MSDNTILDAKDMDLAHAAKRIRELEASEAEAREVEANSQKWIQVLEQRISKAREILEHHHIHSGEGERCPICRAYAALEGK